jgi:hypothetical protein
MTLARLSVPALLAQWARIVDDVERSAGIAPGARRDDPAHDARADADVRHELAQRLRARPSTGETREMLAELDASYRAATDAVAVCIYGSARAAAEGWTPDREWYYWRTDRRAASTP